MNRKPWLSRLISSLTITLTFLITACGSEQNANNESLDVATTYLPEKKILSVTQWIESGELYNPEAPIPSQCYTDTKGKYNPCYVCHQTYPRNSRPNKLNDASLQGDYGFSDIGFHNSWKNLFKDRTDAIAKITDTEILEYIQQDNYSSLLSWMDTNQWQGVNPKLNNLHLGAAAFDHHGLAKDGSFWVAFNYKPLPSTFWPTNGATDDVMIRLPNHFRELNGQFNKSVYYANLSLLEMAISGTDETSTLPINEKILGIDLNKDNQITDTITNIKNRAFYIGDANPVKTTPMLYPKDTEFLHTVRYVGVDQKGKIVNAPRMKEVRYMKKIKFIDPKDLASWYYYEKKEKHFEKLPTYADKGDKGMSNQHGWLLWGFIEDEQGNLRKQTSEEQFFCTGCHKSIGSTIDDTFAFPRKVAGAEGWGYIDLTKMLDTPSRGETQGEYLTYLERVGGGDEFRQNEEMKQRWFHTDGSVKKDKVQSLSNIYELIVPSKKRALALNKAYKLIVEEQSFIFGRDTVLKPATNVLKVVDENKAPLEAEYRYHWDIRPAI